MFFEIILAITLGIFAGIITGLIPGIHINLVSTLLLSISPKLLEFTTPFSLACFIIAMSVTHSFLDVIPSTFLGAPDPSNAMIALPAHKMLLEGKAYQAIRLTVVGSFGCLILGIIFSPLMYLFIKYCYSFFEKYLFWILLLTVLFIILKDKNRLLNFAFFILSGSLGIVALNLPLIKDPLFPMLSGLFGLSVLINSFFDKINIPTQNLTSKLEISKKEIGISLTGGFLAGAMTSFMPGLGASQGAAIASSIFKKISNYGFLIMIGGINTVNFTLSIITFFTIEKARNGSIIAVSELLQEFKIIQVVVFLTVALITGAICVKLCLEITKIFGKFIVKVNYQSLVISVIFLIIISVAILSNFYGVILLICATSLGLIATKFEIAKNHLMGCLLLPVLLYFLPF